MAGTHPCLSCGACCAACRVDFSVYESQEHGGRGGHLQRIQLRRSPLQGGRLGLPVAAPLAHVPGSLAKGGDLAAVGKSHR